MSTSFPECWLQNVVKAGGRQVLDMDYTPNQLVVSKVIIVPVQRFRSAA